MAENTRKDPRAKVLSMTVRYKSATLDEFIEHHSHDVSRGGMYIKTPQPFPPGTLLKFEVKIAADQKVMQGVGRVVWRREADDASADHPAGMGVKFIKLDNESKDIIDQLVTARTGDISAFDEVEPASEAAQSEGFEPPAAAVKPAATEGFFPKSTDDVPQPAAEDRTVMKQATELLQEALKEVGSATGSDASAQAATDDEVIPKAPRVASVTPSPARVARAAQQSSAAELTPRVQRVPAAVVASAKKDVKSISASTQEAKSAVVTGSQAQAKKTPTPDAAQSETSKQSAGAQQPFEPVKNERAPSAIGKASSEVAPKTVPASPMAARRAAQTALAQPAAAQEEEYKIPIKSTIPPGRGIRVGIILVLVGAAAAAMVALSRKTEAPAPAPTPTPTVSQKIESAPVVINLVGAGSDAAAVAASASAAGPSVAASASVAPVVSAAPAVSESPKVTESPKVEAAPKVKQVATRRRKADAGASVAPPSESPDELYPTTPSKPAATDSTGSSDSPPAAGAKSKSKAATPAAPTPAPAEDNPL